MIEPTAMQAMPEDLPEITEIEIEVLPDPTTVEYDEEGKEIAPLQPVITPDMVSFDANLAESLHELDSSKLASMASDIMSDIDNDVNSRAEWERTYIEGMKLLGLRYEDIQNPWPNACGTFSPILTEAVVRFQSEAIMESFPASGPVKTQILGKKTEAKEAAARRVQDDMNYEITHNMIEYRGEHEKLLWNLPIAGSAFKKVYFDPNLSRQTSIFVPAEDIILPYGVAEIFSSPRITHRMRKTENELRKLMRAGFYRTVQLAGPMRVHEQIEEVKNQETGFTAVYDDRYTLYEVHMDLIVEGDEDTDPVTGESYQIGKPYVVTILRDTGDVLSVYRNWDESDTLKRPRRHFVHYQYIPGFGSYGFGLIHLIGNAARSATMLIRQLVDSGTLSNLPGGLKSRSLRIKADDTPIAPGEFRDVDVGMGTVRDNIMPLPYKEPSQTLLALLNQIVDEARRFAATADLKISDMSAQAPVGTTLALLERMLKNMSAVQARMHYSMKQELGIIAAIIRDQMEDEYNYEPEGKVGRSAKKADYEYTDIFPVSDPNAATMSQRVVQYQAAMQMAEKAPQIYDLPRLHRQMLDIIGIKNAEKIVKLPEDAKPQDPVQENMNVLRNVPVKVFAYQDHEAHLATHQAFIQDPKIGMAIGQNPQAGALMAAMQAHIAEHAAFAYRAQVEAQLGIPLPTIDDDSSSPIDPEDEKQLSGLIAQAAQLVAQQNQKMLAMQQQQQAQQDPQLMLAQQELELKRLDSARKAKNDQFDWETAMKRLELERERMMLDFQKERIKLQATARDRQLDRVSKQRTAALKTLQPKAAPKEPQ